MTISNLWGHLKVPQHLKNKQRSYQSWNKGNARNYGRFRFKQIESTKNLWPLGAIFLNCCISPIYFKIMPPKHVKNNTLLNYLFVPPLKKHNTSEYQYFQYKPEVVLFDSFCPFGCNYSVSPTPSIFLNIDKILF